jgi:class 3 adenylate cyclase
MAASTNEHGRFLPSLREFFDPASVSRPVTLRFRDDGLERDFQDAFYRDNLFFIRLAHVVGVGIWIAFWVVGAIAHTTEPSAIAIRIGLGLTVVLTSLACSYAAWFPPRWPLVVASAHVGTALVLTSLYVQVSSEDPAVDWGYAALMGLMSFTFFFSRLQTRVAAVVAAIMIVNYDLIVTIRGTDTGDQLLYANYFLISFASVNAVAAYGLERATRLLWLRERDVDRERHRADALLANTLPAAIIGELKGSAAEPGSQALAHDHASVSVLFADLVSFTERAGRISATELVRTLDGVFTRFDRLAEELGVEKVKTVGDGYLAVAGAPAPREDHATAAAELALAMQASIAATTWAGGEPMQLRIGIASGPVVAGVIGRSRFAYDLWGDTVNLASRLEAVTQPGTILVAASTAVLLRDGFGLSDPIVVELKGKGPTPARHLLGARGSHGP